MTPLQVKYVLDLVQARVGFDDEGYLPVHPGSLELLLEAALALRTLRDAQARGGVSLAATIAADRVLAQLDFEEPPDLLKTLAPRARSRV